jgi:hypothetical protein
MSDESNPPWVRFLDDAIGLIVVVSALVAILELAFSFTFAIEILSLGLIAMGIAWIIWSIFVVRISVYARTFMFVTGGIAVSISVIDFLFFSLSPDLLILFPAIAMLLVGSSRLVLGFLIAGVPLWIQMLQVLAGILTINLAAFVFVFPNIEVSTMLILLIISFASNGLVRLIIGRTETREHYMSPSAEKSSSSS